MVPQSARHEQMLCRYRILTARADCNHHSMSFLIFNSTTSGSNPPRSDPTLRKRGCGVSPPEPFSLFKPATSPNPRFSPPPSQKSPAPFRFPSARNAVSRFTSSGCRCLRIASSHGADLLGDRVHGEGETKEQAGSSLAQLPRHCGAARPLPAKTPPGRGRTVCPNQKTSRCKTARYWPTKAAQTWIEASCRFN